MKLKISKQVYQWTENGEHRIGRIVEGIGRFFMYTTQRLVQRYHTGELHIVPASELTPYYGDAGSPADRTRQIIEAGGPTH